MRDEWRDIIAEKTKEYIMAINRLASNGHRNNVNEKRMKISKKMANWQYVWKKEEISKAGVWQPIAVGSESN